MVKNKNLSYSYLRAEADNTYVLFLKIDESLLEQDIDFNLTTRKTLLMFTDDGVYWETDVLTDEIYYSLAHNHTVAIFTNEEGEPLSKYDFPPLD